MTLESVQVGRFMVSKKSIECIGNVLNLDRFLDEDFFCVPHQLGGVLYNPYLENGYIPQGIPDHQAVFNRNLFQIFDTNGEKLVRLGSSATKKARKRRMTRQRLIYLHDYPHHSHHN
ncbi:TF-B3 domain-containing protein [Forsythia ovata]|uniref:TF-B3 domain-containing protein n=1 Tax=Forsythia ovata TaxID=205694 RepID=A0ABD1W238_9LAMI